MITITRQDISPGYQPAQTAHSMALFSDCLPDTFKQWITGYSNLICLSVPDEKTLLSLFEELGKQVEVVQFHEPDLNNEVTAICLYSTPEVRKRLSNLPLALKGL